MGGRPVMSRTGYPNIMARRREVNAVLAGELSGHIFFNDPVIDFDDGTFAGASLLQALAQEGSPLSEIVAGLPRYHSTPEERFYCPDDQKVGVVERLRDAFARRSPDAEHHRPGRGQGDVRGGLGPGAGLQHRAGPDHPLRGRHARSAPRRSGRPSCCACPGSPPSTSPAAGTEAPVPPAPPAPPSPPPGATTCARPSCCAPGWSSSTTAPSGPAPAPCSPPTRSGSGSWRPSRWSSWGAAGGASWPRPGGPSGPTSAPPRTTWSTSPTAPSP